VWYKKVAMELLFRTTVVNSMIIYNQQVPTKLSLLKFTEALLRSILCTNTQERVAIPQTISKYSLEQLDRKNEKLQ